MKNKIKEFLRKKNSSESEINLDDIHKIKKENEKLKKSLSSQALDKFKTRRSIRKYSQEPIDWETIYHIIEAGANAPCAGNIQNYKVVIVQDKKKKYEISRIASQQYWLSDAPLLLIIVRDSRHVCEIYPGEGKTYCIQNSAAVIENILMMAHFYDLGACWVESYDNEVLKEFLSVPQELTIDAIVPLGYPKENPVVSKQPMVSCVFFEKYGNRERK